MGESTRLERSPSLGGSMISQGKSGPERTKKVQEWLVTKISPCVPCFFDGVTKLERAYHMPLSKVAQNSGDCIEQVVRSLQIVAALLCRLLYYLTASKIAEVSDIFARLQFDSDWEALAKLDTVDQDLYNVIEPVVAAVARIEQTLDKINLQAIATAENVQRFPSPTSTKDMLNICVTRVIKAQRFFDVMTFGLLMRKLDYATLRSAGVIVTLKQIKALSDERKLPEEEYFRMRMTIIDPFIPKAMEPVAGATRPPTALPTENARTAATLRARPGRYSTFEITPSAAEREDLAGAAIPTGFEKEGSLRPRQRSIKVVSFCASPRAQSGENAADPTRPVTEAEKLAEAVSQIALTIPQRRESFSGTDSPRELPASASAPLAISQKTTKESEQRSSASGNPSQLSGSPLPVSISVDLARSTNSTIRNSNDGGASSSSSSSSASSLAAQTQKKLPPIPPKPKVDLTIRGPPPPGSLGPKIPRPEEVNPDLAHRLLNQARTPSQTALAMPVKGMMHAQNVQMFEDLERSATLRKKQEQQLELEIYMSRQKRWEEERQLERERERAKAQETIRNGTWRTTTMSPADVYALQAELTREQKEKLDKEKNKSQAEMQRKHNIATMKLTEAEKSSSSTDMLSKTRVVGEKKK